MVKITTRRSAPEFLKGEVEDHTTRKAWAAWTQTIFGKLFRNGLEVRSAEGVQP